MPYSRRTGARYAAGSQATWSPGDSRTCCVCGQPVTLSGKAARGAHIHYDAVAREHRTSHLDCGFAFAKPLQTL